MHLLRGVPHAPSLNTPIIPLQNCNKIIMFIDYYFLRFCDKLRDSSPNPKNRSTLRPYWVPSAVMSLYAAGFSSLYDVLSVIKFCAPPHSWVSSLSAFDFSFSFFLFLFSLSLSGETRHIVSSHYCFVWYSKSASSLLGRAESPLTSEPGACVCVPACNWSTPPSGGLRWAETWDRGPPVCR